MSLRSYIEVTKPRIVFLLVFTCLAAMVVAARLEFVSLSIKAWFLGLLAITAGCAGCNAVTCYIDKDIDSIMERTKKRPLPSKRINPPEKALYWGLFLIMLSLFLASLKNLLSLVSMALGVFDNVIVYSWLLKRRSPLNILLGGISGGLPTIFGWTYVANNVSLTAFLMAAIVVFWIPNHIWSLALRFKEDYSKANVPMLPVVVEEKKAVRLIVTTSFLLIIFSVWLFFSGAFGRAYFMTAIILGALMGALNLWLFIKSTKRVAWLVFKLSSPYLAMIFFAIIFDSLFS